MVKHIGLPAAAGDTLVTGIRTMNTNKQTKQHVATSGGFKSARPFAVSASDTGLMSASQVVTTPVSPETSDTSHSGAFSAVPVDSDVVSVSSTIQEHLEQFPANAKSVSAAATGNSALPVAVSAPLGGDPILITITREQIACFDFSPILSRLGVEVLPTGHELAAMMGKFKCRIVGYKNPYNTLSRQDVCEYLHRLDAEWPYWAYFFGTDVRPPVYISDLHLDAWSGVDVFTSIVSIAAWRTYGGPYRRDQPIGGEFISQAFNRALHHLKVIASMSDLSELQVFHHFYQVMDAFLIGLYNPDKKDFEELLRTFAWPMAA